ncbi:hypothetical protein EWM64_g10828 [Hericium alpestre]|uniref:lipoate--protein ligase n=1 Tax=Hericium alpestre TaxID=135208 RepID=A0A4Y9ZH83_9AGAM|nr:hypothetical protein EWM64_g10828 [Hericium alpestre]
MLLSSRLHVLGDALRVAKDTMVTKGVASVRSPVRNLCDFRADITHESFVEAVVWAFREEYHIDEPVQFVNDEQATAIDYIRHGMAELPSWDWAFGQTPEFTYKLRQSFSWGDVTADLHSRHGIILSCDLVAADGTMQRDLQTVGAALRGQKYGFVDDKVEGVAATDPAREVWSWLQREMSS